ncbi:MAG: malto-oligosyltrehalose trehalohydrolase [Bryobacteraceae bacterium]|nr:malto-oligosyltrehalose trehalohydrolase [Bryobacteraceae bacterium]
MLSLGTSVYDSKSVPEAVHNRDGWATCNHAHSPESLSCLEKCCLENYRSIWAPLASEAQLYTSGRLVPMRPRKNGWYDAAEPLHHGDRYGFVLDGRQPLPDPRSDFQPQGVHQLSEAVDHDGFEWNDEGWQSRPLSSAIIYELHVGTFSPEGTFEGAIAKLPYLANLGVTHLQLMPVAEFSGDWGWGYDGVSLFAPHHCYGGPLGLKKLINAAHLHRLAVLLDVVYNHLGPSGNYLSQYGPYFTTRHKTPWGDAVNLDGPSCFEVRRFFIDNARHWLETYHFDGLRLDAVHALIDSGATHFLEELSLEIERLGIHLGRHLVLIAESDLNDPRIVRSREAGGYGIDAQWSDDFHHAVHTILTGENKSYYSDFGSIADLAKTYNEVFVYNGNASPSRRRPHGRPVQNLPSYKFISFIQNHDQTGNRAHGERFSQLTDIPRAKLAAALVLTAPFIPMLFQGEEWAASSPFLYFTNHEEPDLARAVSEGRSSEFIAFGWSANDVPDPQEPETFTRSRLRWEEALLSHHKEVLDWYKRLVGLRRRWPDLTEPSLNSNEVHFSEEDRWLTVSRGSLILAANLSDKPKRIPLTTNLSTLLLTSDNAADSGSTEIREGHLHLGPWIFAVCR